MLPTSKPAATGHAHQKSFKRKYRKLRHRFKHSMGQSDELFRLDQVATAKMKRLQEENNRLLDLLLEANDTPYVSRELRHTLGDPDRDSPYRFVEPNILDRIDISMLEDPAAAVPEQAQASSSDDTSDDEPSKTPGTGGDEDDDSDEEAYLEDVRMSNYRRGIPGTPPRFIREKTKAAAEQERKAAQEATKAAAAAAAAGVVKTENGSGNGEEEGRAGPRVVIEPYRRGHTPEHLKEASPFFMSPEEEDQWYDLMDNSYGGGIPPSDHLVIAKADGDMNNPMSVYNWLKIHQPQVFLQAGTEEDGGKKKGKGGRKKKVVAAGDGEDEDGETKGTKRKRKAPANDEDGTGPRGGKGRGRGKRKDGEPSVKKQKSIANFEGP